jgi:hypothetical protein
MADERGNAFDPDKIAAVLDKAAESYTPEIKTIKAMLSHPTIIESVRKMKARGASPAYIVKALQEAGITMSAGTFNKYWPEVSGEQKDETDGKPGRKPRKTNPRTTAGTSESQKTVKPAAAETKQPAATVGTPAGTNAGTDSGTATGKKSGLADRARAESKSTGNKNSEPDMGGVHDERNF